MRYARNGNAIGHGTRSMYQNGCNCEPCQQANRDYGRVYAQKTRERMKAAREAAKR